MLQRAEEPQVLPKIICEANFLVAERTHNMVPSLARQAIIIKCNNDTSVITGNYELAYALGLMVNQTGILFPGDYKDMKDLHEKVMQALEDKEPEDERVKRLHHMLKYYHPTDDLDEQMGELVNMGLGEKHPWDMFRT